MEADDDLERFAAEGAPDPGPPTQQGWVARDGARIWYASHGAAGPAAILLHGGLGHSGNWGHQVPALRAAGYRVVLVDSRGHGRSTQDGRPLGYRLMAADLAAVIDALRLERPALVGWSDGACTALTLAMAEPERTAGVLFFACNMDHGGARPEPVPGPALERCFARHGADYARLSATPFAFADLVRIVTAMQRSEPDATAAELAAIRVPVAIVQAERDEFIRPEHAAWLARAIPGARHILLPGVSHFAPLQRPALFNAAVLAFLGRVLPRPD
ncbi:MAG: alpha/beta hydrolase [Dongiaceae bacterium]